VLEAMACGRPVVAANSGGLPELVAPGTGILAPPRDADALAAAITALYDKDMERMGRSARAHVERTFGWDSVMRALLASYSQLTAVQPIGNPEPYAIR